MGSRSKTPKLRRFHGICTFGDSCVWNINCESNGVLLIYLWVSVFTHLCVKPESRGGNLVGQNDPLPFYIMQLNNSMQTTVEEIHLKHDSHLQMEKEYREQMERIEAEKVIIHTLSSSWLVCDKFRMAMPTRKIRCMV